MAIVINGSNNTISGLAVGGLPDGVVDADMLAAGAASGTKLTMPTGSVIQIVEGSATTQEQPTGQNYVGFLSKTITPLLKINGSKSNL